MGGQFIRKGRDYWEGRERFTDYQLDLTDIDGAGGYVRLTLRQSRHGTETSAHVTFFLDDENDPYVSFKHSFCIPVSIAQRLVAESA